MTTRKLALAGLIGPPLFAVIVVFPDRDRVGFPARHRLERRVVQQPQGSVAEQYRAWRLWLPSSPELPAARHLRSRARLRPLPSPRCAAESRSDAARHCGPGGSLLGFQDGL